MRGNATANTPVTGQRPSHKMDFMTPIDTTRSLFPSLRRRCPISVPLSLSMDNCRRLCLPPIPLERPPLLQSTSFRQTQGKPKTEYNSFVCRMYSLMKKFSIPFLAPFPFRSFIHLLQATRISGILRRLHVSVYIDVGLTRKVERHPLRYTVIKDTSDVSATHESYFQVSYQRYYV